MRRVFDSLRLRAPDWMEIWFPLRQSEELAERLSPIFASLKDGETRLATGPVSQSDTWTPECLVPSKLEAVQPRAELTLDMAKVADDYLEECRSFLESLDGKDQEFQRLAPRASIEALQSIIVADLKEAAAMRDWRDHAIPLRYHDGHVYRIWPEFDLLAVPVIKKMSAKAFVAQSARYTAMERLRVRRLKAQRDLLALAIVAFMTIWGLTR